MILKVIFFGFGLRIINIVFIFGVKKVMNFREVFLELLILIFCDLGGINLLK